MTNEREAMQDAALKYSLAAKGNAERVRRTGFINGWLAKAAHDAAQKKDGVLHISSDSSDQKPHIDGIRAEIIT